MSLAGGQMSAAENQERDIQSILREFVDEDDAIGVAVGIIDQGKVSYFTYGKKSLKNEDPITTDTMFEIGSMILPNCIFLKLKSLKKTAKRSPFGI
jgi:CubicO group peptidase (beta-lactamase class C family)